MENILTTNDKVKLGLIAGANALIAYFAYKTIKIYLIHRKYRHIPGPPNKGLSGFYFGQGLKMIDRIKKGECFAEDLVEWTKKYGTVIKYHVLDITFVHTVEPDAIHNILIDGVATKNPELYHSVGYPLNERFLGSGMVTEVDEKIWRNKRALFNSAFHRKELKSYLPEFNLTADALIERLRAKADGKTVIYLHKEISQTAMDTISNIAFGMSLDSINTSGNKIKEYFKFVNEITSESLLDPYYKYNPFNWKNVLKFKNTLKILRNIAKQQIINRMNEIKNGETLRNDILTYILKSQENKEFDMENMIDEFITFFFAGHETTAGVLGYFFLQTGRNPQVYEKLRCEIDNVMGSRSEVRFEDLSKFEYTSRVLKEVLRLYPPASVLTRINNNNDWKINDYNIPSGAWITVSPYSSHRYEKHFKDPQKFDPDRFMAQSEDEKIKAYTYFPFSLGSRNCIGQNFAQFQAKVIIAKILQNFDIEIDLTQSFDAYEDLTVKPRDGTRCVLKLRH